MTAQTFDPAEAVEKLSPPVAELLAMTDDELREYMLDERADDGGAAISEAIEILTKARAWLATQTGDVRQSFSQFDRVITRITAMRARLDREAPAAGADE